MMLEYAQAQIAKVETTEISCRFVEFERYRPFRKSWKCVVTRKQTLPLFDYQQQRNRVRFGRNNAAAGEKG